MMSTSMANNNFALEGRGATRFHIWVAKLLEAVRVHGDPTVRVTQVFSYLFTNMRNIAGAVGQPFYAMGGWLSRAMNFQHVITENLMLRTGSNVVSFGVMTKLYKFLFEVWTSPVYLQMERVLLRYVDTLFWPWSYLFKFKMIYKFISSLYGIMLQHIPGTELASMGTRAMMDEVRVGDHVNALNLVFSPGPFHFMYTICFMAGAIYLQVLWWRILIDSFKKPLRWLFSSRLRRSNTDPDFIRDTLRDSDFSLSSAAVVMQSKERDTVAFEMKALATDLGLKPYYLQMSKEDQLLGRNGSREYHFVSDLRALERNHAPSDDALLVDINSSYYIDINWLLNWNNQPIAFFVFQPNACGRAVTEKNKYSYTFEKDVVTYYTAAGDEYKHMVWNFQKKSICIPLKLYFPRTTFGITYGYKGYMVYRKSVSLDHEIVILAPIGTWYGFTPSWYGNYITGDYLERFRLAEGGFNRLRVIDSKGDFMSTSEQGASLCATIPFTEDNCIKTTSQISAVTLNNPQVLRIIKETKTEHEASVVLVAYHRQKGRYTSDRVYPPGTGVRRYQIYPALYEDDAKASMQHFMKPIVNGAFAPDKCYANDLAGVIHRIIKVQAPFMVMDDILDQCIDEFLQFLIPIQHEADPIEIDEVYKNQPKPQQQRILQSAEFEDLKDSVDVHPKGESYPDIKPERIITTYCGAIKRDYSAYLYEFSEVIKKQDWYAFGKSPREVADRVVKIAQCSDTLTATDFSKFDGHLSNLLRVMERRALLRHFKPKYRDEIRKLHAAQYNNRAIFRKTGVSYWMGYARGSGSFETAPFNTMENAFIAYLSVRRPVDMLVGTPQQAWDAIGICGGDDGLIGNVTVTAMENAAKSVGQDVTIEVLPRESPGVRFLATYYGPDVWYGSDNTCIDYPRILSKIHVTPGLDVKLSPIQKLGEKLIGLALCNSNTPVIAQLIKAFERSVPDYKRVELKEHDSIKLKGWLSQWLEGYDKKDHYRNEHEPWMDDILVKMLPDFDYKKYISHMVNVNTERQILDLPRFNPDVEPTEKLSAVLDDRLILANEIVNLPNPVKAGMAPPPPIPPKPKEKKEEIFEDMVKGGSKLTPYQRYQKAMQLKKAAGNFIEDYTVYRKKKQTRE